MQNQSTQFSPPPRHVPLSLSIVNFFNGISQIAWFVVGFGMIFFWGFAGNGDFSFITFRGAIAEAGGVVTRVDTTGASENEQPVYASHYEYSVNGVRRTGTSYSTGSSPSQGDRVTVQYKESNPDKSRIAGMRRAMFGPFVAFVTIFPFIGLIVLYFATKSGIKRDHLLRVGIFTTGKLLRKEPTNMTVNKRPVWELTFEFIARDGRRAEAKARTTFPQKLEDEAQEPLLYDPDDLSRAYVLDEAPARPKLNMLGELEGRPIAAVFAVILPAIVIGGHLLYFYVKLR